MTLIDDPMFFRSLVLVALINGFVRAFDVARDLVIASFFGIGDVVDMFVLSYLIVNFLINVFLAPLASCLTPQYIALRRKSDNSAQATAAATLFLSLVISLALVAMIIISTTPLIAALSTGFSEEKAANTRSILLALLPILVLQGFSLNWSNLLNARDKFALAALVPAAVAASVVGLLFAVTEADAFTIVIGVLIGNLIQFLILAHAARHHNIPIVPKFRGLDQHWIPLLNQYKPLLMGAALMGGMLLIDHAMAAALAPGSLASLNYGNKITAMILAVAAIPLNTVALPYFSLLSAGRESTRIKALFAKIIAAIFALGIPVAGLLFLYSEDIVQLVFERGEFKAADTEAVARIHAYYVLQIPFYLAGIVGARVLTALRRNHILMFVAAVSLVLNGVLNYVFILYFGVSGIAVSTTVVYLISFVMITSALAAIMLKKTP